MKYSIYLSGEIHSDWRERIVSGLKKNQISLSFALVKNTNSGMRPLMQVLLSVKVSQLLLCTHPN
jgi:hypothetical protein